MLLESLADGVSEEEIEVRKEAMTVEQGAYHAVLQRSHSGGSMYVDQANRVVEQGGGTRPHGSVRLGGLMGAFGAAEGTPDSEA